MCGVNPRCGAVSGRARYRGKAISMAQSARTQNRRRSPEVLANSGASAVTGYALK